MEGIWTGNILWLSEKKSGKRDWNHWHKLGPKAVIGKRLPSAKAGGFLARRRAANCSKEVPYYKGELTSP